MTRRASPAAERPAARPAWLSAWRSGAAACEGASRSSAAKRLDGVVEWGLGELGERLAAPDHRRRQGLDRLAAAIGGPQHPVANERRPADHPRLREVGEEAGLDQGRLARAARAEHQDKGGAGFDPARQNLAQFVAGAVAAKEERRVLELERQQAAIGVVAMRPRDGAAADAPPDQRAQMILQHFLELRRVGEGPGRSGRVAAFRVGKPLPKERLDPLLLFEPLAGIVGVVEVNGRLGDLAVHQDLGGIALAVRFDCVFELPLGAADLPAGKRSGKSVAWQGSAKARPQNDDNDVGVVRRSDQFLEMMRGQERLALPHHRAQIEMEREFLVESPHHPLGDQPLGTHVGRRGDEHPQCSSLGLGHRFVPSAPAARNLTANEGKELSPSIDSGSSPEASRGAISAAPVSAGSSARSKSVYWAIVVGRRDLIVPSPALAAAIAAEWEASLAAFTAAVAAYEDFALTSLHRPAGRWSERSHCSKVPLMPRRPSPPRNSPRSRRRHGSWPRCAAESLR